VVLSVGEQNKVKIESYKLPLDGIKFGVDELVKEYLFVSQPTMEQCEEDHLDMLFASLGRKRLRYGGQNEPHQVFGKYKPVDKKVRPVLGELMPEFRVVRHILGDPLAGLPNLPTNPPEFSPKGRYTAEGREVIRKKHDTGFLWPEELKLIDWVMMIHDEAFAWDDSQRGRFKKEFFPDVKIPVVAHVPWVERNIPIPPGLYKDVCELIRTKINAGTYEPSNSSYRSKWFCVFKKDGKSFRIVHSLEPLNKVTVAHSGLPPATEELAADFAGRACIGVLDLYVGYDERVIDESSRDLTTFQTPFGALRLTKLPMGWTNSVPIFHDDVTYILQEEIPQVARPYIDDVGIKGPKSRYELPGGKFETIPENNGIRRFVWEHMHNVSRVLQRLKFSGATVSGYKALLCGEEGMIVGHLCSYEGRKPNEDRVGIITRWGPCKDLHEVNAFLGTTGTLRMFIKDYAKVVEPINRLKKKDTPFVWGEEQDEAQARIKQLILECPALKPIDYESPNPVILAVDTSYIAVGYYIFQEGTDRKPYYARFDSLTLNEREARFSQPKRELYGLKLALRHSYYWLAGCRKLVVQTDAKYIKGMLQNPTLMPNATLNRWIEEIMMFHFKLVHVPGKTFGPDGPSRRPLQPGDPARVETGDNDDVGGAGVSMPVDEDGIIPFEEYKDHIDSKGGFTLTNLATEEWDFAEDCKTARKEEEEFRQSWKIAHAGIGLSEGDRVEVEAQYNLLMPDLKERYLPKSMEPYPEDHRSDQAKQYDRVVDEVETWMTNPHARPADKSEEQWKRFLRMARQFFYHKGRLYRKGNNSEHKLVVKKSHRMYMLKAAHDALGHRGTYATGALIGLRFWWPAFQQDVNWYIATCDTCQKRREQIVRAPPVITHTPSIFQEVYLDTVEMTPASNKCKYVLHGRCGLSSWAEARAVQRETAKNIARWLFEDIITRWGCLQTMIIDNAPQYKGAVGWLRRLYGITGITISPYNSKANGRIERPHIWRKVHRSLAV
jgi:hypothetical protein